MVAPEFKHLKKEQLKRRLKILPIFIYLFAAVGIAAPVVFFMTDYKYNWSWLLIGVTYILLTINFAGQMKRIRKEIQKREDRLASRQMNYNHPQ